MTPDVSLWAMGVLCSFIGGLLLIILTRVLRQGDETAKKIDLQGIAIVRIEATLHGDQGIVAKVNRLHDERNRQQAERLQTEIMENAELRSKLEQLQGLTRRKDD